jgi:peptidyl-prolyl cis-trans isomerase A (cyclophilin A)
MRNLALLGSLLTTLMAVAAVAESPSSGTEPAVTAAAMPTPPVEVVLQTSLGAIRLQLDMAHAPVTAGNFLRYVDQKRFDGCAFYRALKIGDAGEYGLVQAGLRGHPKKVFKPIPHEPTSQTGLSHQSGAISMARAEPGTATADFFIVLGDLTALDAHDDDPGYAAFGHVIAGMDVVRALLELPRSDTAPSEVMKGQMLATPVPIATARRVSPN